MISSKTKGFIISIQQLKNCEFVCLFHDKEIIPIEDHSIDIGEVVAVSNSATIAEALERAARSGLERRLVDDGFETVGNEELANNVLKLCLGME